MQQVPLYLEKRPRLPKILVIDDEHQLHQDLRDAFEEEYDFLPIICIKNRHVIINFIQNNYFDLLLLDLHFEERGAVGLDLLKTLRKEFPKLPIIVITKENKTEVLANLYKYGATTYLPKQSYNPFVWKETINKIICHNTQSFDLSLEDLYQIQSKVLQSIPCTQEVKLNYFPNATPHPIRVTTTVISGHVSLVTLSSYQFITEYWKMQTNKPIPVTQLSLRLCNCSNHKTEICLLQLYSKQSTAKVEQMINWTLNKVTNGCAPTKMLIEVENINYH